MGKPSQINIKIIGIGGFGCNCLERLDDLDKQEIERIAIAVPGKTFNRLKIKKKIALGEERSTADLESINELIGKNKLGILNAIKGADLVFLVGSLSKDVTPQILQRVAEMTKDIGILTFAITSKPFSFEGKQKKALAEENYQKLTGAVDAIIAVVNDKLLVKGFKATEAFSMADKTLANYVNALIEIISKVGMVNIDFNDFKSTIINSGEAFFGTAMGDRNKLESILDKVVENKYFETRFEGSEKVLYVITADSELSIGELDQIGNFIKERASENSRIIFGLVTDETLKGKVKITILSGCLRE